MKNNSPFSSFNSQFQQNRSILLVEDNIEIQLVNSNMLKRRGGYNVYLAMNLEEARGIVASTDLDIILLDITLPDGSGLDFLAELRQDKNIPVLILSAHGKIQDKLKGLEAGSDDYLSKPYDNDELILRIESLLRRAEQMPKVITKGALTLRVNSNQAFVNGVDIMLGQNIEFSLLNIFVQAENKTLSAEYLYEEVWGQPMAEDDNAVRKAVTRLRTKLEKSGYTIITEHGKGYRFEQG